MINRLKSFDTITQAKLAVAYSGVVWGLYWIPLRLMDQAGVHGAWPTVIFYVVPLLFFLPWNSAQWKCIRQCRIAYHAVGIVTGVSLALYANAMLYTEVVRAVLLFYMTPIWSLLLARILLGEVITAARVIAIILGISGLLVILGIDQGSFLPRNIGDWMALLSGLGWAIGAVLLRKDDGSHAREFTTLYFFYGSLFAVLLALSPGLAQQSLPEFEAFSSVLPWFVFVGPLLLIPGIYSAFWGAPHLNPGAVGLIFMTEISVATVTAAIWANEPFGARELTGVILISLAGLSEFFWPWLRPVNALGELGKDQE